MPRGPGSGRIACARVCRAIWPCLALTALNSPPAHAQALTPALFSPEQGGFVTPQDRPLRRTAADTGDISLDPSSATKPSERGRAPSRIGKPPTYGQPAASGAAASGFDSLNRKRKPAKYYPAQVRPKQPGPGSPPPISLRMLHSCRSVRGSKKGSPTSPRRSISSAKRDGPPRSITWDCTGSRSAKSKTRARCRDRKMK